MAVYCGVWDWKVEWATFLLVLGGSTFQTKSSRGSSMALDLALKRR